MSEQSIIKDFRALTNDGKELEREINATELKLEQLGTALLTAVLNNDVMAEQYAASLSSTEEHLANLRMRQRDEGVSVTPEEKLRLYEAALKKAKVVVHDAEEWLAESTEDHKPAVEVDLKKAIKEEIHAKLLLSMWLTLHPKE